MFHIVNIPVKKVIRIAHNSKWTIFCNSSYDAAHPFVLGIFFACVKTNQWMYMYLYFLWLSQEIFGTSSFLCIFIHAGFTEYNNYASPLHRIRCQHLMANFTPIAYKENISHYYDIFKIIVNVLTIIFSISSRKIDVQPDNCVILNSNNLVFIRTQTQKHPTHKIWFFIFKFILFLIQTLKILHFY